MNCNDLSKALIGEPAARALRPESQEHLKSCKPCQDLVRALSQPVSSGKPSTDAFSQIEHRLIANLEVVRPMAPPRYLFFALVAIFVSVVSLAIYRFGAFAITAMSPLQVTAILGTLAISTGLLAYSLVNQMAPGSRHRIPPRLLPMAIMMALIVSVAVLFRFQHDPYFWARASACMRAGAPIGFIAAIPFWLVLRRGAILSPAMTGAATGLLAGLVGTSVLEIHCPNLDGWHILVSHLGIAALSSIAGLGLGLFAEFAARPSIHRTKRQAQFGD